MACIVLPSETARLVYGYLVKENLNNVAEQFLEMSPYLLDCRLCKRQGLNFETQLFSKDLHELLQEYKEIRNLVSNKINTLPKNSSQYRRIKLNCQNLLEKMNVLLFWKYKYQKKVDDDSLTKEKEETQKSSEQINVVNNTSESNICKYNTVNEDDSKDINEPNCADNNLPQDKSQYHTNDKGKFSNTNEIFNGSISFETAVNSNNLLADSENFNKANDDEHLVSEINVQITETQDTENSTVPKEISNVSNINSLIQTDNQCFSGSAMEVDSVTEYDERSQIQSEGNIEIVRIEPQRDSDTQTLNIYENTLKVAETNNNNGNITEESPVVFLDPAVGNFKISSDPNQIIVIPINYYKESAGYEDITTNNQEVEGEEVFARPTDGDCNEENDFSYQVIPEEPVPVPVPVPIPVPVPVSTDPATSNSALQSNPVIDSNIITADNFATVPAGPLLPAVQDRVILVPQVRDRFRKILPRAKKNETISPAVVYVNVPSVSSDFRKPEEELQGEPHQPQQLEFQTETQPQLQPESQSQPQPEAKLVENNSNSNKKQIKRRRISVNTRRRTTTSSKKTKSPIIHNVPNVNPVTIDSSPLKEGDDSITILESSGIAEVDRAGEEKENEEEKAKSKIETPLVLSTRNSKRLSLSTPRRRSSHIRALEFETPPKANDEKKKSQTSPKVKIDQVPIERKNVRNTLFKSPDLETIFKSPVCLKSNEKTIDESVEPLNELSIPIATRSPRVDTLSETWDDLTGVRCVLDKPGNNEEQNKAKSWDSDLRSFIPNNDPEIQLNEKKRSRKPEKCEKDNKKPAKKKLAPCKSSPPIAPSSALKINITATRNTYSISENEEKSPVRPFQEDANLVTPFKYPDAMSEETPHSKFRSVEDTPITISKLLRENGLGMDIDLSMISTPVFPPTPSILEEDLSSMSGAKYFSPSKDESRNKSSKITDYFQLGPSKSDRIETKESPEPSNSNKLETKETHESSKPNKLETKIPHEPSKSNKLETKIPHEHGKSNKLETKETHEKMVSQIITKAQEVVENQVKFRPSGGKLLSMHKIITIATSDKKLIENIPINDETILGESTCDKTIIEDTTSTTLELKDELEEKRRRTVQTCKGLKENLVTKQNLIKRCQRKRKRSGGDGTKNEKKSKLDVSSDTTGGILTESDDSGRKDEVMVHSTPYSDRRRSKLEPSGPEKKELAHLILSIIPPFEDHMNVQDFPELPFVWRKKLYYVQEFLKLDKINEYLKNFNDAKPSRLKLTKDMVKFCTIFGTWAKELNGDQIQASDKTKKIARDHLIQFNKIKKGLTSKRRNEASSAQKTALDAIFRSYKDKSSLTDDEEEEEKKDDKKKEEETEDGIASTLPLKKRKANVQPLEKENSVQVEPEDLSMTSNENFNNQSQKEVLQNLDLEHYLCRIHGQTDV